MTGQISDSLVFQNIKYSLAAIEADWPFKPQQHGFAPVSPHTACWRGYYCVYTIKDGFLAVKSLNINLGRVKPTTWLGIAPVRGEHFLEYRNPLLPVPYTGGIIIAHDFLSEFYVHMGFQRPHCYKDVKELIFLNGQLQKEHDHSDKMEAIREKIRSSKKCQPDGANFLQVDEYVTEAFSLNYQKKWA